nr:amidohydrolase family protein [Streptomyces sp. TLI_235]
MPGPGRRAAVRRARRGRLHAARHCSPDIAGPGRDWAEAVGEHRWNKAWPMRSLHEAGAVLALSSDWNVAEMDPLVGLYTAVTRRGLAGGEPWMPGETLDLATALRGYTLGSAHAVHLEHELGSLTPGKLADLVMLSDDLFEIEPKVVHRAD